MITAHHIKAAMSAQDYARGRDYYERGKVNRIWREGEMIRGQVAGSELYEQHIILNWPRIEGECSCPVGYNCKHVVAVLLTALDQSLLGGGNKPESITAATNRELSEWLKALEQVAKQETRSTSVRKTVNKQLRYRLDIDANSKGVFTVQPVSLTLRKDGSLGQLKPYEASNVRYGNLPKYLEYTDKQILQNLADRYGYYGNNKAGYRLSEADDDKLLETIIATGRGYWQDVTKEPLSPGEARGGSLAWQMMEGGHQRLACQTQPESAQVALAGETAYYIDADESCNGSVNTAYTPAMLKTLLTAPPIAAADAQAAVAGLRKLPGNSHIPAPKSFAESRQVKGKPTPHLRLGAIHLEPYHYYYDQPVGTAFLELQYDYQGHKVSPASPEDSITIVEGEKLTRIARDSTAEGNCEATLKTQHFNRLALIGNRYRLPEFEGAAYLLIGAPDEINTPESLIAWADFVSQTVPKLRKKGWQITLEDDFPFHVVAPDNEWYAEIDESSGIDWFGVEVGVEVGGKRVNLLPLLLELLQQMPATALDENPEAIDASETMYLPLPTGELLALPMERVLRILSFLKDLYGFRQLAEDGSMRLSKLEALDLAELEAATEALQMRWHGGEKTRELGRKLKDFEGIKPVSQPEALQASLRDYQREGLSWLQFLREYELAGILADDMGLGKTIQVLAHLAQEKQEGRLDKPVLVIAPTSLMVNWEQEAARFVPHFKVLILQGAERKQHFDTIGEYDLVLSTYALLPRDKKALLAYDYHSLILDEAQYIKNPKAKITQIASQIQARHRICMTGTPVENHLGELWSLFNFLMPGYLGDDKQFRKFYRKPIEREQDQDRNDALIRRIKPFVLRRTKEQVATELPAKTEMIRTANLAKAQQDLYETLRVSMHEKVRAEIVKKGLARSHIIVLDALLKLRQTCCDPQLLKLEGAKKVTESAKRSLLMELLTGLVADGRKILLFSQFVSMLKLIEADLKASGISYVKLTGQTKDRKTPVEQFQRGEVPLFLISLKAGGTGLNLTAADTVIHYDPWWNPAVENQATDRAHRIGQDKPVFVYKLITSGTVEEKILEMQEKKRALAEGLFTPGAKAASQLTGDDISTLFEAA